MSLDFKRVGAWVGIATALAAAGDKLGAERRLQVALTEANNLADGSWKWVAIGSIPVARTKIGDIQGATSALQTIPAGFFRDQVGAAMGQVLLERGDIAQALSLASRMSVDKETFLINVAAAQARHGDVSVAVQTADTIRNEYARA
jgi:hypothetical protein